MARADTIIDWSLAFGMVVSFVVGCAIGGYLCQRLFGFFKEPGESGYHAPADGKEDDRRLAKVIKPVVETRKKKHETK